MMKKINSDEMPIPKDWKKVKERMKNIFKQHCRNVINML